MNMTNTSTNYARAVSHKMAQESDRERFKFQYDSGHKNPDIVHKISGMLLRTVSSFEANKK